MKKEIDFKDMAMSEKANMATAMGDEVGKIINNALKKANKLLKKAGYAVTIDNLNFHEIDDKDNKDI